MGPRMLAVALTALGLPVLPAATISGVSPFHGCTAASTEGLFENAEVEPSLTADPAGRRIVAIYQQDRYTRGAARGIAGAVSGDGGRSWRRVTLPFGACAAGGLTSWPRVSDPWVSIDGGGRVYAIALGSGIAVTTSTDGGRSFAAPTVLAAGGGAYELDKPTLTADPAHAGVAYAVWQRYLTRANGPPIESDTLLRTTRDGGRHWTPARVVLARSRRTGDVTSQILVDDHRRLLYHLAYRQAGGEPGPGRSHESLLVVQRSRDDGRTWSAARTITAIHWGDVLRDPTSGAVIRPGVASFALDPRDGTLYATWQDTRFSGGRLQQVAFAASGDGGRTWRISRVDTGNALGLIPTVAAGPGRVAVAYYAVGRSSRCVVARSDDEGVTFRRNPVGSSFAFGDAPLLAGDPSLLVPPGLFLGDYIGVAVAGGRADVAFPTANRDHGNRTDVHFASVR
jgi:hypothetical protein